MLYRLCNSGQRDDLCLLTIRLSVLDLANVVVTDQNAVRSLCAFYSPAEGLHHLQFPLILAEFWKDKDEVIMDRNKGLQCAEVLIPERVPYSYISGAITASEQTKYILQDSGFSETIIVDGWMFFTGKR